jgi:hypothetical protein
VRSNQGGDQSHGSRDGWGHTLSVLPSERGDLERVTKTYTNIFTEIYQSHAYLSKSSP